MYGDQQQECGYVHQGVQGAASGWGTHGLYPRFIRPDQDTCIYDGLRQGYRQEPYRRRILAGMAEVRSLPVEVCQSGTDCACLLYGQLPG